MTREISAILCQLTRLQHLELGAIFRDDFDELLFLDLDLPLLERLKVTFLNLETIQLICPKLTELGLDYVGLKGLCGMPSSIRKLTLSFAENSLTLREVFPMHTAEALEELVILEEGHHFTDPDTVKTWCLNGKLSP